MGSGEFTPAQKKLFEEFVPKPSLLDSVTTPSLIRFLLKLWAAQLVITL